MGAFGKKDRETAIGDNLRYKSVYLYVTGRIHGCRLNLGRKPVVLELTMIVFAVFIVGRYSYAEFQTISEAK